MAKADKPKNFKGIQAMVINSFIDDDACIQKGNGYSEGDVVDFFPEAQEFSDKEYAELHIDIIFIKNVIMEELELMTKPHKTVDGGFISRRLWKIDKKNPKVKDKFVWDKSDYTDTVTAHPTNEIPPPVEVRVG